MLGFLKSLEWVFAGSLLVSGFMLGTYVVDLMKIWLSEEVDISNIERKQMALSLAAFILCAISAVFWIKTVDEYSRLKNEMATKKQYGAIEFTKTGEKTANLVTASVFGDGSV